ncbi:phage BR0599 family protein [Neoaquamicrobium sediminum]|uniref:phage BR0599 family protein n=1 Tax=Neoaquamicrobium sediminum TaxID=1849104 RepID=UPI0015660274|nr:phage BR0599 family protein [Mesorhizobium sediminum]NRC54131.1 DUF2163 domain-containing protein [Mesorhizobium sediminum]
MSFQPIEESQERGAPVELYEFIYGSTSGARYHYTNADQNISFGGATYKAIAIDRDTYSAAGKTDRHSVNIRLPVTADLAYLFTSYPPTQPVVVIIRQGHLTDNEADFIAVWTGRCLSAAKEGNEQVLTCESTIVSLKRPGLRRNYQFACPYVLYGEGCFANKAAATSNATVVEFSNGKLTLDTNWWGEDDPQDYAGGMIQWNTDKGLEARTILTVDEEGRMSLIGPLRDIVTGEVIQVIKGCNHRMDGCRKHNNIQNFGGQPWIPLKNPVKYHPFW